MPLKSTTAVCVMTTYVDCKRILAHRTRLWFAPERVFTINNFKYEIRISKFETNPNIKFSNVQNIEAFDLNS